MDIEKTVYQCKSMIDKQCVLKWGKNLYDIDLAVESGLQFKERIEKLTRFDSF